jgi:hypothetical protein
MSFPPTGSERSRVPLYALVGVAVLVGLVASLLIGAAPPPPRAQAGEVDVNLPAAVWGLLLLGPLVAGLSVVAGRAWAGTLPRSNLARMMVTAAVIGVLALLFIYLAHGGGSLGQGTITVSTNPGNPGHGNLTPPSKTNISNQSKGTAVPGTYIVSVTPWVLIAVIVGISVCVAVLAFPRMLSRLIDRAPRKARVPPTARAQVQAALADAGAAIDRGADPRETVIRLYLRLLYEIAPRAGDVSPLTPDEIRRHMLAGLGVGAAASEALTRLFEEARYSSHPIGPGDAQRFREAIRQVDDDLRRSYDLHRSVAS